MHEEDEEPQNSRERYRSTSSGSFGSAGFKDYNDLEQDYDEYGEYGDGRMNRETKSKSKSDSTKSIRYISRIMPTPGKTPSGIDDSLVPPPPSAGKMESMLTTIDNVIPDGYQNHPEVAKREIAKLRKDFYDKSEENLCQTKNLFKDEFTKIIVMRPGEKSLEWCQRLQNHVSRFGYFVPPLSSVVENHPRGQFYGFVSLRPC